MEGQRGRTGFWEKISGPRTQPSLFHYIVEEQPRDEPLNWKEFFSDLFHRPRTQASLFNYNAARDEADHLAVDWKDFFLDLFRGYSSTSSVHFLEGDPRRGLEEETLSRKSRQRARMVSIGAHALVVFLAIFASMRTPEALFSKPVETIVFLNSPIILPWDIGPSGPTGGGGGGGGKQEQTPPSGGRMPETAPVQMIPPDPADPQPLLPAEDLLQAAASVQMPVDIPQDQALPIGDLAAPANDRRSSGPGVGGGMGVGTGTGLGSGSGPGVGPGSGGGMGGGSGGGIGSGVGPGVGPYRIGSGVREPVLIYKTLPNYTEEARRNRVEGIVMLEVVIRADGSVDNARVVRGLGFGLDESAIREVVTKWKFKPGTLQGRPVDVQAYIEVSFRLL